MNKPVVGILVGAALGAVDGASVWVYPKTHLVIEGFAFLVAAMPHPNGLGHPYVQIMAPGFVLGAITGFLTQRMGTAPARAS
jgi:hypothetical protein